MGRSSSIRVSLRQSCSIIFADPAPIYVWPSAPLPSHHYELTRPFAEPILYVSLRRCPDRFQDLFATVDELGTQSVPVVKHEARVLHFCRLAGYRPSAASNAP